MKKLVTLFTFMAGAPLVFAQPTMIHNLGAIQMNNIEAGKHQVYLTNTIGQAGVLIVGTQYKVEALAFDTNANSFVPVAGSLTSFRSTTVTTTSLWGQFVGATCLMPTNLAYIVGGANFNAANPNAGFMGGVDVVGGVGESFPNGGIAGDTSIPAPNHDNYDTPGYFSPGGDGYYPVQMYLRAWDSSSGSDYAHATIRGQSAVYTYKQHGNGLSSDTAMSTQPVFGIVVPEPSAIALSVLGVAGLLLIRRRK